MHRNLSVIAAVFLVAGCASSTAEFDGEKVTVRSEGSALLYSLNGLKARTETYAKELCTKQFGANSVLGSEEKKITASKSMGSIAELSSSLGLGFFDLLPTYAVTRQWPCSHATPPMIKK